MAEVHLSRPELLKLVVVRFGPGPAGPGGHLLHPGRNLDYWQAWAWMAVVIVPMLGVLVYLMRNDPALLERRMRTRETEKPQTLMIRLSLLWFGLTYLIPGLDRRFGWSHVPAWLVVVSLALVLAGYLMIFFVFRENSYASRVVEVEKGQKVIDTGPYAVVRHPMYTAFIILYCLHAAGAWLLLGRAADVADHPHPDDPAHSERGGSAEARAAGLRRVHAEGEVPPPAGHLVDAHRRLRGRRTAAADARITSSAPAGSGEAPEEQTWHSSPNSPG